MPASTNNEYIVQPEDVLNYIRLLKDLHQLSDDPHRKVAAIIIDKFGTMVSGQANGFVTPKPSQTTARQSRENQQKYFWIEHAERKAIFDAIRSGADLDQATMLVSLFPCADCARAIVQSGITTLVTPEIPSDESRYRQSMDAAHEILFESGVNVITPANFYFES